MTYGSSEKTVLNQARLAGQPIPDFIKNKPELESGLDLYLRAYFDLDAERTHYFGPSAIPTTAIITYAKAFRFDEEELEDLVYFIRQMDSENLKRVAKLQKAKGNK